MLTVEVLSKGIFPWNDISSGTYTRGQGWLIGGIMTYNNMAIGIDKDIGVGYYMVQIGVATVVRWELLQWLPIVKSEHNDGILS